MPTFNRYLNGVIKSEHLEAGSVSASDLAINQVRVVKFSYLGTDLTTGAQALTDAAGAALTLPGGAIVLSTFVECEPALTSDGAATVQLGYTGVAGAFLAATAFDNAALVKATAKWVVTASNPHVGAVPVSVLWTIGAAALTGGIAHVYVSYITTL